MKKVLEFLLEVKAKESPITLYYPGMEISGILQDISDENIISLISDDRHILLDGTSLIGFSQPLDAKSSKKLLLPLHDDYYNKELLSITNKIEMTSQPTESVINLIKSSIYNRVQKYQHIMAEVKEIIHQMDLLDGTGINAILLSQLNSLKCRNRGCISALKTLEAGIYYAGGNKEKAIEILWRTGRCEIALIVIGEIWDSQIYLDCLGYVVSDFDTDLFETFENFFCYYVKCCADQEDISFLAEIIESGLESNRHASERNLLNGTLLYLIQKKGQLPENISDEKTFELLKMAKNLYSDKSILRQRQDILGDKLEELFAQANTRVKDENLREEPPYTKSSFEMYRPQYYIGIISDRFNTESSFYQFRVKFDINQKKELYLHSYQIADPLLLHKLTTSSDYIGTKVCFRFGYNDKGICVADAVMAGNERITYRESLGCNMKKKYMMPDYFNYLRYQYNEENVLGEYNEDILRQASVEAQKENLDHVEWIIFLYNYIMNRNIWRQSGYPHVIMKLPEVIEYLENSDFDNYDLGTDWADGLERILIKTGNKGLIDVFLSMREGMSNSSPLYIKPKPDPSTLSREELLEDYIFPACDKGDYEEALKYIQYWKKISLDNRKTQGRPWERVCMIEKICNAALEKQEELFENYVKELSNILTESQREKLNALLRIVNMNGDMI